jgi:hypothetical protein
VRVDMDTVMRPATASTLPYQRRMGALGRWVRRTAARLAGRPHPARPTRGDEPHEHAAAIARGAVRPHSGRHGVVIDLRDAPADPMPERDRLIIRPADELRAQGRAAGLGLHDARTR